MANDAVGVYLGNLGKILNDVPMTSPLRFCLVLHNHQPVGNFDHVFEQAYNDSYLPFLEVLEQYESLRLSLHTSGPLMEWLCEHRGEYVDRLAALVASGRVEIIGGAYYEPILTMIPSRDRVGQIAEYRQWLEERFGGKVQGMWMPERVWESSLTSDLAEAGVRYTVLDDFHFKNAGLTEDALHGSYITEDDGRLVTVFPGSEPLRYAIPFEEPHKTIDYLRHVADRQNNAVVVFGDDGEKFGSWPETKQHVYDNGWLRRFFDALMENSDWLHTVTLAEAVDNVPPLGKIYLPDASYREMTEWALPTDRQLAYEDVTHQMGDDPRWENLQPFIRAGFWRNFKVKYPEANEMYARMMMVSRRLRQAEEQGVEGDELEWARRELYRGQCNCAYWHGAFGGLYLPHLRNAIYNHLIAADNLLDRACGKTDPYVEATADDYNFDIRQEVRLAGDKLICLLSPATGGQMYELDVRSICHNLLATMTRRPEAYHRKVLAGGSNQDGGSIHDRVVFKQEGLDQRLGYDDHQRKSLVDHFYAPDTTLEAVCEGQSQPLGDFVHGIYETRLRRNPDHIQVQLTRNGTVDNLPIKITKGVTMKAGTAELEIAYLLEGVPQDRPLLFAVEMNFAGLPAGADDRYFYHGERERIDQLGARLDIQNAGAIGMVDEWLGIDVRLSANRPSDFWTYPVETVSQSEGGFELVHQSVVVQPHWFVQGDTDGRWSVTLTLTVDTSQAEGRMSDSIEVAAS